MAVHAYPVLPDKKLGTDILSTGSTFTLQDIVLYTGSDGLDVLMTAGDFGSTTYAYGVFEPRTSREEIFKYRCDEIASFETGITITARGLGKDENYDTESATRKFNHSAGSTVLLFTNVGAFYNYFADKSNDETITGTWTYTSTARPKYDTHPTFSADEELVDKKYADDLAIAGAADGSTTVKGIFEEATGAELAAGTATGGTGARLVASAANCKNSSAGAGDANKIPVLNSSGILDSSFIGDISKTADQIQITTDPDSANDPIRKTYADNTFLKSLNLFGDGSDGDVVISAPTSLSKDMFYNDLTINNGITLTSNGFRIYVKGTLTNNGTISNPGGNGGNSSAGVGGTAGAAGAAGTLGGGGAGAIGATCTGNGSYTNGNNGDALANSIGGDGGNGGAAQTTNPATAGIKGVQTASKTTPRSIGLADEMIETGATVAIMKGGVGGGSGGASSNSTGTPVAQSGGAGGGAGIIFISGKTIVNAGSISAKGGDAGTSSVTTGTGCAGGSGGGGGGFIYIRYNSLTGAGTITALGGSKSAKAQTAGTAADGADGSAGTVLQVSIA
jgi:hypothetical protein